MRFILSTILLLGSLASFAQDKSSLLVHFDFDRSVITPEARRQLDSLFGNRHFTKTEKLEIHGHCDYIGSDQYNEALSKRRVQAVVKYLLAHYIKQENILISEGHGEREPLNENKTEEERWMNRRVAIIFNNNTVVAPVIPVITEKTTETVKPVNTLKEKFTDSAAKAGTNIILKNINFIGGSHHMLPESYPIIYELLDVMKTYPTLVIEIQGHICCERTDGDGMDWDTYTNTLSENRAHAIHDYLISEGIDRSRVSFKGFGHSQPIYPYPEKNEEERITNRRVEIKILKR